MYYSMGMVELSKQEEILDWSDLKNETSDIKMKMFWVPGSHLFMTDRRGSEYLPPNSNQAFRVCFFDDNICHALDRI